MKFLQNFIIGSLAMPLIFAVIIFVMCVAFLPLILDGFLGGDGRWGCGLNIVWLCMLGGASYAYDERKRS